MTLGRLLEELNPDPVIRGRAFEHICRWFLLNAPEYRPLLKQVWLWDEWPDRWGADAGIDLVAETIDGHLWAVQAKLYREGYAIKKADVDSFLAESARKSRTGKRFAYRLLIATTDHLGLTARKTLEAQETPVGLLLRSQLEAADVAWPASAAHLAPVVSSHKAPRHHQREAIGNVVSGLESVSRGQLLMACGTGKTLVGLWVDERLGSRRTLVLVPSLSLLRQTLCEWAANASKPFRYLAVCSDETVAPDQDELVASATELGIPVTTDPDGIESFLRTRGPTRRVIFASYQSSPRIADAHALGAPPFDLVIADEAHRCAGPAGSDFATVLDDERIRANRRLFMTATPRYYTGRLRREARDADFEVASMDDEARFGRVLHHLTFGEAIARDLLSDYQVVVVGVTGSSYRELAERGAFVTRDGSTVTDARALASQIALVKAIRKYDLRRIVSFHGRIPRARSFATELPDVIAWLPQVERPGGSFRAEHVSGQMSAGERDRRLRRLRMLAAGERALLANARCLAEGVDVPTLDGVAFIDPRRSQIDIIQAVGRSIRKAPDKRVGTIILPVFVEENDDPDRVLSGSDFEPVWSVLKALRAHDNDLAEELDELRRELGRTGSLGGRPGKIMLDLPTTIALSFAQAFDAKLIERTSETWEFWFGLLTAYAEREGTASVPVAHVEDGHALGEWVRGQRRRQEKGKLSQERFRQLDQLPGWRWDPLEAAWEEGFRLLLTFIDREGHSRVPQKHLEQEFRLGKWVNVQRVRHGRGSLETERVQRLENLPNWAWDGNEAAWEEGFRHLLSFVDREDHSRVRSQHLEQGFRLGQWVLTQRAQFSEGSLRSERVRRLEALPQWAWNEVEARWEAAFDELVKFVKEHGHARVPQNEIRGGLPLGKWVNTQRVRFQRGKLDQNRAQRLAELDGWVWHTAEASWEEAFEILSNFAGREGHARPPSNYRGANFNLGGWVKSQRRSKRTGGLDAEKQARLEALPGWTWNTRAATWEDYFRVLTAYARREGHAHPPRDHEEGGVTLGRWVDKQRQAFKRGELDSENIRRLEQLPGWVWAPPRGPQHSWREERQRIATDHSQPRDDDASGSMTHDTFPYPQTGSQPRSSSSPGFARRDDSNPG